jgi:hypothetical protein
MPSPFPGMDPYLEGPIRMSFHTQMAVEIARQLTPLVRPRYVVLTVERFVTEQPDDVGMIAPRMHPDAAVVAAGGPSAVRASQAVLAAPLVLETVVPERIPHVTVEIRFVDDRELVTAIELLSPTNKSGTGRREYLAKRAQIPLSDVHLLEIDLLRHGQRVPMQQSLPDAPYFVFLSRAGNRPRTEVWPIGWDQPLPQVTVPLLPGDEDVTLDLQRAFTTVYDDFAYDANVDYQEEPKAPLDAERKKWLDQRLRAVGARK